MTVGGKDEGKLNIPEQVSDKSMEIAEDAFFQHLRGDRDGRLSRLFQTKESENFERLKKALTLFDEKQDVMEKAFERRLEQYFDTLISFLETAVEKQSDGTEDWLVYQQAVEELYLINCERIKQDNSYRIYKNHPMLLMYQRLDADTVNLLKEKERKAEEDGKSLSKTDYEILHSVFDAKMRNRRKMKLYSRNAVYETKPESFAEEESFVRALSFGQLPGNTEIPQIRIWEKITNYLELHPEKKVPAEGVMPLIKIAVFGYMKKSSRFEKLLEKLQGIKIKWTFFRHTPITGEYYFESVDDTGEEVYDLLDMPDLQTLASNYQIILFLDQNCFYRQGQAEKDVREKSAGTNCRWNFDRSRRQKEFKDKAAFYQAIYNRIGQWINSSDSTMSAAFEFDERLYKNLEAVSKEDTDIYLYIRYGGMIGRHSLSNNGICNDEYYDGMSLTVCRLTKSDKWQFNDDYEAFLVQSDDNKNGQFQVPVRFWKLLKSVSNQYCDKILEQLSGGDTEKLRNIVPFLNESYLILRYDIHPKDEKINIGYKLSFRDDQEFPKLQMLMKDIAKIILGYAFGRKKLYCMNRYFERLLIHSAIANANDVGDVIFANWMATHWYKTEKLEEDDSIDFYIDGAFSKCKNRFKVRKTVYSIVGQLNEMRMRNIPDMREYFFGSFCGRVCPEVNSENVERTFRLIRDYCELFQHTGGYLYMNSKIIEK